MSLSSEQNKEFVHHQVEPRATTPIYMLNVLWFKPDGGAEKYHEYSQAVMPLIQKHGGLLATPLFQPQQTLLGEFDADLVFVMQFPSMAHFQQLLADPDLPQVAHLREEAITNSLLVQCSGGDWST